MTVENKAAPLKHQEFILAIANSYFTELRTNSHNVEKYGQEMQQVIPFDFQDFTVSAKPHLIVGQRLGLETNALFRQILPYCIFTQKDKDGVKRYINYNRAKGSGESRLLGGRSVGFGGHPDYTDLHGIEGLPGQIDLASTILGATDRELDEELVVTYQGQPVHVSQYLAAMQIKYLILSHDKKVGIYHVALIVEAEMHPDFVVASEEDAIAMRDPSTLEELLADPELEDWSRLFLEFKSKENTEYTWGPKMIVRPGSIHSLVAKIGEETFTKIESIMQQLLSEPSEEHKVRLHSELDEIGFVDLVETPQGLRWSFNEQSYDRIQLGKQLDAAMATNAESAPQEQEATGG